MAGILGIIGAFALILFIDLSEFDPCIREGHISDRVFSLCILHSLAEA